MRSDDLKPGSRQHVARAYIHDETLRRLRQRHAQTANRHRSGRTRVTARRQNRHVVLLYLRIQVCSACRHRKYTLGHEGRRISSRTVRKCLYDAEIHYRRSYIGSRLT